MIHRITLSNGRVLLIEERNGAIHLGDVETDLPGDTAVGSYICTIDASGVLVMPNSGGATADLTADLKVTPEEDSPDYCAKSPDHKHHGKASTITPADISDSLDDLIIDINCRYCGRSGGCAIDQKELNW